MTKTKLYKDPSRNNPVTYKPYVPAYKIRGYEPQEIASGHVSVTQNQLTRNAPVTLDNPRIRPANSFRKNVPYAEVPPETSPIGQGPIPNNGNNMETSWVSVDGEDFDNVFIEEAPKAKLNPNHPMIDNNDDDDNNYKDIPKKIKGAPIPTPSSVLDDEQYEVEYQASSSPNIKENDYVIVISNAIVATGSFEEIQEEVRALIFSEDNDIKPDDIIVLKRVKIKVGVFLE